MKTVSLHELKDVIDKGLSEGEVIIDVRTPPEHREKSIKGTINIPLDEIEKHADEIKMFLLFVSAAFQFCIGTFIFSKMQWNK